MSDSLTLNYTYEELFNNQQFLSDIIIDTSITLNINVLNVSAIQSGYFQFTFPSNSYITGINISGEQVPFVTNNRYKDTSLTKPFLYTTQKFDITADSNHNFNIMSTIVKYF